MAKEKKKSVGVNQGDTVNYVSSGGIYSTALVTRIHDKDTGLVNLFVIRDDDVRDYRFESSVKYSDDKETGTWHFIEKE